VLAIVRTGLGSAGALDDRHEGLTMLLPGVGNGVAGVAGGSHQRHATRRAAECPCIERVRRRRIAGSALDVAALAAIFLRLPAPSPRIVVRPPACAWSAVSMRLSTLWASITVWEALNHFIHFSRFGIDGKRLAMCSAPVISEVSHEKLRCCPSGFRW